jgi:hypothetical protein
LLYLKNDKQVASSTLNVTLNGIKFFYQHTLRREWPTFDLVRSPREKKLPVVLSAAKVPGSFGPSSVTPYARQLA